MRPLFISPALPFSFYDHLQCVRILGLGVVSKRGFSRHWLGKWVNTSVNHNQQQQFFKGNYGLYFLFWDRMMGTIRKDYEEKFEEVKSRK